MVKRFLRAVWLDWWALLASTGGVVLLLVSGVADLAGAGEFVALRCSVAVDLCIVTKHLDPGFDQPSGLQQLRRAPELSRLWTDR